MRVPAESSPDAEACHDTLLLQHLLMLPFLLQERELPILLTSADILVTHPVSESNKAIFACNIGWTDDVSHIQIVALLLSSINTG